MDNMPTLNPNVSPGQLSQDVSSLQGFSGIVRQPVSSSPYFGGGTVGKGSAVDQFFGKVGSVFKESAHLFDSAASWVGRTLYTTAKDVVNLPASSFHLAQDTYNTSNYSAQSDGLNQRLNNIFSQYKSGQINSNQFKNEISAWQKDSQSLSVNLEGQITKSKSDSNAFLQDIIATETTIAAVATGGLVGGVVKGGEATSLGSFLASQSAREFMAAGEQSIAKLAANKALFDLLPQGIQSGIKGAVTDTFLRVGADMTASQIARATAVNLAIKYPLAFNYLTGTSNQIIDEMNSGKYGNAVKTLAFNMALLFSGGPIGQALKYGGKGLSAFSGKMFGSTSFIDELSKAAGYGPADIFNALKGSDPEVIKAFQALEATNMAATDGRAIDAAYRITDGLKQNAPDIFGQNPKEFVQDVHNWYLAQKDLTDTMTAKVGASEARKFVVGRWSAKTANYWAAELTKPGVAGEQFSSQRLLDRWNEVVAQNPNTSFANNKNLYKQIENIIGTSKSWEEVHTRISKIPAQIEQDVPKGLAKRLSDRGYIAIAPGKLEAPFVESSQPLKTAFAVGKNVGGEIPQGKIPIYQQAKKGELGAYYGTGADFEKGTGEIRVGNIQDNPTIIHEVAHKQYEALSPEQQGVLDYALSHFNEKNPGAFDTLGGPNENIALAAQDYLGNKRQFGKQFTSELNRTPNGRELVRFFKQVNDTAANQTYKVGVKTAVGAVGKNVGGDFFTKAVQPAPVLGDLGTLLTHIGLSPNAAQESVSRLFNEKLLVNLEKASIKMDPYLMRSKLADYMNQINASRFTLNHPPLMDMRQLTVKEISQALKISDTQAKEVSGALMDSMLEVPASVKGLGNKLVDKLMTVNNGGKFSMGGYLRAQGAGRFSWNPFFQMKASYKYEALTQMETGGKFPTILGTNKILGMIFPGRYAEIKATAALLEKQGMLGSGFAAEAASETAAGYGLTTAKLTQSQKLTIGSYVMSMANKMGLRAEQFIQEYPNQVRDATESILHYNPKANFLNSPLARTLNFAFFPFRFDVKVATYMARTLQRQDLLTQVAVVHGMFQAHAFLTSTEGQIWYSQNSDVIGLLEYFTPVAELKVVAALGNIRNESVGSFGLLGGLPVGFIPQLLAAEGLWNPSTPYVNPKTGAPGVQYIPATDKAKLATAISSFIGSLFSYPGAEAGLPGKTKALANLSYGLTGAKAADWNKIPENNLTPQQQQFQQAIQSLNAQTTQPQQGQSATTMATESGNAAPIYTPSQKRSRGKLKKSQEPVQLLPGQTQLGQIP